MPAAAKRSSLRLRFIASVLGLVLLSLLGSTVSLYRITEVNKSLDAINQVAIPLGRLLSQMQADAEVFQRELERSLGASHWKDPHWRPRPIPKWIDDLLANEITRVRDLVMSELNWAASPETRSRWIDWAGNVAASMVRIQQGAQRLQAALAEPRTAENEGQAEQIYAQWSAEIEQWRRELAWGSAEYERGLRQTFGVAEKRVSDLRAGLELILAIVILMSLSMLWLGERALRPLGELTRLAQEITRRGLRREDKDVLPMAALRSDEVSSLALEFRRMATALLEREKTVEAQTQRLAEQNRRLIEMSELEDRLRRAEHLAAVGRMSAQVAHEVRNPLHSIGLEAEMALELAAKSTPALKQSLQSILGSVDRLEKITENYLKLSRLSAGKRETVDLGEVLESVLATYAQACERQGVQVDWRREPGSNLSVNIDRDLVEQVLGNLLRNSLQALEGQPEPAIRWAMGSAESGRVWLRIQDNGPGVDESIRTKLFTPFVTTRAQGTGLGLSFIKRALEEQGGDVRYVEGQGACFEITLPAADPVQTTQAAFGAGASSDPEVMA